MPSESVLPRSLRRQLRMEPLWSPVVATGGNRSQIGHAQKPQKQAKTVAVGCDRLPQSFDGKEGVDGSSPSEGSAKGPHVERSRVHVQIDLLFVDCAAGVEAFMELSRSRERPFRRHS